MSVYLKLAKIQEKMITEIVQQYSGNRTSNKVIKGTLEQMRILEYHIGFIMKYVQDSIPEEVASELRGLIAVYQQLVTTLNTFKSQRQREIRVWIDRVRNVKRQLDSFLKQKLDSKSRRILQRHTNDLAEELKKLMIVNKNS